MSNTTATTDFEIITNDHPAWIAVGIISLLFNIGFVCCIVACCIKCNRINGHSRDTELCSPAEVERESQRLRGTSGLSSSSISSPSRV